eukprot:COSAG04_NODE_289_length_17842_cov_141.473483_12_plen_248_part_00
MPEPAAEDAEAIASANEFLVAQRRAAGEASSQYYGVHWNGRVRKWRAQLQHKGKTTDLLKSDSEEEAARAFDAAARRVRRPASTLNFPTAAELPGQDEPAEPPKAAARAEKKPKKKPPPAAPTAGARGADGQEERPPNSVAASNQNGRKGYTPEVDEWLVSYIDKHGNRKASWYHNRYPPRCFSAVVGPFSAVFPPFFRRSSAVLSRSPASWPNAEKTREEWREMGERRAEKRRGKVATKTLSTGTR